VAGLAKNRRFMDNTNLIAVKTQTQGRPARPAACSSFPAFLLDNNLKKPDFYFYFNSWNLLIILKR
jgi:hypothetical protein